MKKLLLFILIPFLGISQTQIGQDIDGEAANDQFGRTVFLSSDGNILAIGANGNGNDSGHVRVYQNIAGNWSQIGSDIDGEGLSDNSGISVSLSDDGSILAIGAFLNDGGGSNSGHVRIYQNIAGNWTQIGTDIDGEAADDQSGTSVSLSSDGSIIAIGANGNDGNGSNSGHVRVYHSIAGNWTQIGADINGEAADDQSGFSVSLSSDGTILAIGANLNDGNGLNSGHVRVYQNTAGNWAQIGSDIDGEAADDRCGFSVSLSNNGNILAIGAIGNDGNGPNAGHVRVYQNIAGNWTQIGADIDGEVSSDNSGRSVSLSSNGNILAIGANGNDGNGNDSGHVRVYQNIAGNWSQSGIDINGEAVSDSSGISISLSSDGSILAIGAFRNDGNGNDSGHVRAFNLTAILASNSFVQANFKVYPNPVSEILTIELQNNLELQNVNFYNTVGQLVKTTKTISNTVSDLSKGTYYVEVITNQGKATKTIIIE
jgi:hypothetical protein